MRHSVITATGLVVAILATLFGPIGAAGAVPTIVVGSHDLLANQPDQVIQIFVTGGDLVAGVNFYLQVANGGPEAEAEGWIPAGTAIDGPTIADVDLLTDTIFAENNLGQVGDAPEDQLPQVVFAGTLLSSGSVPAEGLLATITIDTTGFTTGSFDLSLTAVGITTDFAGIAADITDGTINIVQSSGSSGADAGDDQEVHTGDTVEIEGSAAEDDGSFTYQWVQTGGPNVTIADPTSPTLSFTAPAVASDTQLTFELRVFDGSQTLTDTVMVTVLAQPADETDDDSTTDDGSDDTTGDTSGTDTTEESSTTTWTFSWGTIALGVGLLLLALWWLFFFFFL